MMKQLSRKKLKKLILQEITTTKHRSRRPRGEKAAEMDFFGSPLEPSEEILDSAEEKELLAMTMKRDDKADVAYKALFVVKDPIAWKVYNRFKAQDKNIFGNEKEFLDEYWNGPEAKARGKELFKQAQATKAGRPPAAPGKGNPMLAKFVRDTMREAFRSISLAETPNKELINYTPENRAMKKSELLKIIREEVEVILTNEEVQEMFDFDPAALIDEIMEEEKNDKWMQKAVDPEHEGDCTPMTKSTCTPARKALAKRFKKAARKKKKEGGTGWEGKV